MQDTLRITEVFYSLQGETRTAGLPTVFVRLTGCPLRCGYCDSAYAFSGGPRMHIVRPGYIFGEPVLAGTDAEVDQRFVQICRSIKQGLPIRLIKHDGTQFIHARDIAEVYLALLSHPETFSIHYALANEWVSWAKIAEMAMEEAGKRVAVKLEDCNYSPVPYLFDVRKLEMDFELSFVNEQELREHIRWALSLA